MDSKMLAVVLIASLAFAGSVSAGWFGGMPGWHGQNGTMHGHRPFMMNGSASGVYGQVQNWTAPNMTVMQEFQQAVASEDYQTAMQIHNDYGLGGPIFDRLNETTFSQYSQIYNLVTTLEQTMGIRSNPGQAMGLFGMMGGQHRGWGHRFGPPPMNQTAPATPPPQ